MSVEGVVVVVAKVVFILALFGAELLLFLEVRE